MKREKLLSISEAARILNVSIDTLRRWDASGKLKAVVSEGGHRYYVQDTLERFLQDIFAIARVWAGSPQEKELADDLYCGTQDVFRARLDRMAKELDQNLATKEMAPLVTAIAGEIGNNSFDHNLGSWPDVPGTFFGYDLDKKLVVLADRGQGIRATLMRVRPELEDDIMALRVAFTERVSGRAPEQRGNGLKFVRDAAANNAIGISLQSGLAVANINKGSKRLSIALADENIRGVLAKVIF